MVHGNTRTPSDNKINALDAVPARLQKPLRIIFNYSSSTVIISRSSPPPTPRNCLDNPARRRPLRSRWMTVFTTLSSAWSRAASSMVAPKDSHRTSVKWPPTGVSRAVYRAAVTTPMSAQGSLRAQQSRDRLQELSQVRGVQPQNDGVCLTERTWSVPEVESPGGAPHEA
ncbi:hypothetical protein FIBSPDRAFT_897081 [Athelia psychrophila]|uniref:Uncharacterized protein n=1 Tax=Athelia psychrophila TaxID=1759441 RepID=A0A166CL93_9AGAM|nr:hypothetical protein FIBSPDRAFT_897081 [Fibularhizoctonia sp. CBS 109695]